MIDIRCPKCGRKLMESSITELIRIKCPKCKEIIDIKVTNEGARTLIKK